MSKAALRLSLLQKRKALTDEMHADASQHIAIHLKTFLDVRPKHQVFGFWPYRREPDLRSVWEEYAGQRDVGLPVVLDKSGTMTFKKFETPLSLMPGLHGILEPAPSQPVLQATEDTIVILPCVSADLRGVRLGYGGGYYDRYLSDLPNCLKIGVLFQEFFQDYLPSEGHDQLLNGVLTEVGLQWVSS